MCIFQTHHLQCVWMSFCMRINWTVWRYHFWDILTERVVGFTCIANKPNSHFIFYKCLSVAFFTVGTQPPASWSSSQAQALKVKPFNWTGNIITCYHLPLLTPTVHIIPVVRFCSSLWFRFGSTNSSWTPSFCLSLFNTLCSSFFDAF